MILSTVPIIHVRILLPIALSVEKIMSSDGEVLAQTNVSEDGTEERSYPYNNVLHMS